MLKSATFIMEFLFFPAYSIPIKSNTQSKQKKDFEKNEKEITKTGSQVSIFTP